MKLPPLNELTPAQALAKAIKASQLLQGELNQLSELTEDAADAAKIARVEDLTAIRDKLIRQTFAQPWQEAEVKQHLPQLNQLEELNTQLTQQLEEVRSNLFQQRVDNQQGRKAVSAYGNAKSQWQG